MKDKNKTDILNQFVAITAVERDFAQSFLEIHNWNLDKCINTFLESPSRVFNTFNQQASDEKLARELAEQDDASLAHELGKENNDKHHEKIEDQYVPPPKPTQVDQLFNEFRDPLTGQIACGATLDPFRDYSEEFGGRKKKIFKSNAWENTSLSKLFCPPEDIMFRGTLQQVQSEALARKKWIIVNIQDTKDFSSHMLNRDTWSKPIIKELIKKFFIFWQINKESESGKQYCAFYSPTKMPHIAVLDPVTRQKTDQLERFYLIEFVIARS